MRVLAAEHRMQAGCTGLLMKRFEIMGDHEQVFDRSEPVFRVSPVALVKRSQLTAARKAPEPLLNRCEIDLGCIVRNGFCQSSGLARVGVKGADDIHPIQGVQMIEVDDVVVQKLCAHKKIADNAGIFRDGQPQGIFHAAHRGGTVNIGAHPAQPLGKNPGVFRIAPG